MNKHNWPRLNFKEYQRTLETLHQWFQIVGKIRLKTMPWQNHSWHVTLYVTSYGFSTYSIPYQGHTFQIDFDFKNHRLSVHSSHFETRVIELRPMTVSDFYQVLFATLSEIGINVRIHAKPNELEHAIPFEENTMNRYYDAEQVQLIWKAMSKANEAFQKFRSGFIGKVSPVQLFWGAFDLAVTRFSGRPAPLHSGGMPNMPLDVMQEAYSKEVSSAGFWLGSEAFPTPIFYAYVYPENPKFKQYTISPKEAFYSEEMGEFMLKYEDVILSKNPEKYLAEF